MEEVVCDFQGLGQEAETWGGIVTKINWFKLS